MTELRMRRKEAGLCVNCGRPARPGRVLCPVCAEKNNEAAKRTYYKRLKEQGLELKTKGRPSMYEYIAWRGRTIVIRGTPGKLAKYFGTSTNVICNLARNGGRRHKGMTDPVAIERRRIDGV